MRGRLRRKCEGARMREGEERCGKYIPCINNIIQRMLVYEPQKRISAKAALEHPYFNDLDKTFL